MDKHSLVYSSMITRIRIGFPSDVLSMTRS